MPGSTARKELEQSIELMNDRVKKNVVIVGSDEFKYPFLYHIGGEKNPTYTPRIGQRQSDNEDRTVPRVTASTSLLGCILGYGTLIWNFFNLPDARDDKGGLYIHRIPFDYVLKPNNKLVYDQSISDEHWLTTYNKDTVNYKGQLIGKIIVKEILCKPVVNDYPDYIVTVLIELTAPMPFSAKENFEPGYYKVILPFDHKLKHTRTKDIKITPISKDEFTETKKQVAVLLSVDNIPARNFFKKW